MIYNDIYIHISYTYSHVCMYVPPTSSPHRIARPRHQQLGLQEGLRPGSLEAALRALRAGHLLRRDRLQVLHVLDRRGAFLRDGCHGDGHPPG